MNPCLALSELIWSGYLQVLNVDERRAVSRGPLPLSAKATLTWLALAHDTLTPVTMDSRRVLRAWNPAFGGTWSRAFPGAEGDAGAGVWPAGVSGGELHFVQCEPGETPQVCSVSGGAQPFDCSMISHRLSFRQLKICLRHQHGGKDLAKPVQTRQSFLIKASIDCHHCPGVRKVVAESRYSGIQST